MILYYSGTGNTEFVAKSLSNLLDESAHAMPYSDLIDLKFYGDRLIFCFPVYSWGVPPFVASYVKRLLPEFVKAVKTRNIPIYLVLTAGDEVARTVEMFRKVLKYKDPEFELKSAWSVIMPNDYVLLPGFDVDPKELADRKSAAAAPRIREIADKISKGVSEVDVVVGRYPSFKSRVIFPLFEKYGINYKWWKVSDACIGCGKCEKVCPMANVILYKGKPEWEDDCVSCTACYQICPVNAISYGVFTKGKGQYYCKLEPLKKEK